MWCPSNVLRMDVKVTEAALALARRKGGNIALDFIRPHLPPTALIPCAVAFLVPRNLIGWAASLTVDAKRGLLGSKFVVEAGHAHGPG